MDTCKEQETVRGTFVCVVLNSRDLLSIDTCQDVFIHVN